MNRIERMVAEMCPDGVEFFALSSVVSMIEQISWDDHLGESFQYVDLGSVNSRTGRIDVLDTITALDAPSRARQIIVDGDTLFGTTRPLLHRVAFVDSSLDGQICSTGYCVLRPINELIEPRFLFHLICSTGFLEHVAKFQEGASYPSISRRDVLKYLIPVPPIEIQREIVDILDSFTRLEAELEAELEARKAQYAFFRDRLLSFDFDRGGGFSLGGIRAFEVKWAPMGEVFEMRRGHGMPKELFVSEGVPAIHYGHIYTRYGVSTRKSEAYVAEDSNSSLIRVIPGDVVMAATSENLEDVGKATVWLGDRPAVTGGHTTVLSSENDGRFISHYLRSAGFQRMKRRAARGTKVVELSGEPLSKIKVPIPPLEVQRRIADVLDDFDALVNDLSSGLPAEIAARRQQYEYYRDRLLTFPEKK